MDWNALSSPAIWQLLLARRWIFIIFGLSLVVAVWFKTLKDTRELIIEIIKDILFKPFK